MNKNCNNSDNHAASVNPKEAIQHFDDEYLDTEQTARYTKNSASTWAKRRMSGDSPVFCKVGRKIVYRKSDLDAWLLKHRRRSTNQGPTDV